MPTAVKIANPASTKSTKMNQDTFTAPVATVTPAKTPLSVVPDPVSTPDADKFNDLPVIDKKHVFGRNGSLTLSRDTIYLLIEGKLIPPTTAVLLLILLEYGTKVLDGEIFFTGIGDACEFLAEHNIEDKKFRKGIFDLLTNKGQFDLSRIALNGQLTLDLDRD